MGIFEGVFGQPDYGDTFAQATGIGGALGNAQNMTASQYNQMMNNQIAMAKQNAYNAATQRRINVGAQAPAKPFNPNEIEAYQIPLSQLVTLWQVRYGDKWVEMHEAATTEFFDHAVERLSFNNLLEEWRGWARIKEGV